MLARLIYVSEAADPMSPADVEAILKPARQNNHLRDISGMLLFNRKSFLQVIEGDAQALTDLYGRIANDTRHRHLKLLHFGEVAQRLFGDWAMGFAGESSDNRQVFLRHTASSQFLPYQMGAATALALLLELSRPASARADTSRGESPATLATA